MGFSVEDLLNFQDVFKGKTAMSINVSDGGRDAAGLFQAANPVGGDPNKSGNLLDPKNLAAPGNRG